MNAGTNHAVFIAFSFRRPAPVTLIPLTEISKANRTIHTAGSDEVSFHHGFPIMDLSFVMRIRFMKTSALDISVNFPALHQLIQ